MFDPYAKVVYDYLGGIEDLRKAKVWTYSVISFLGQLSTNTYVLSVFLCSQVRTVFHAGTSFQEDCGEFSGKKSSFTNTLQSLEKQRDSNLYNGSLLVLYYL